MSDAEIMLLAKIQYNCREKFYRAMQLAAVEGLKRYPGDPVYRFCYGISLILENRIQEGIRELYTIQEHRDVALGCTLALIYAHKKCKVIDREAIDQLEFNLREAKKQTSEKVLYYGGLCMVLIAEPEKGKGFIEKMMKVAPYSKEGSVLRGWIELVTSKDIVTKDTLKYFESSNNSDPEAVFGRAKYFEKLGNYSRALEILNQAIVLFPNYTPTLIEKMKMQLALQDWDQMLDSCHRARSQDKCCLEALRFSLLHTLCQDNNYEKVANKLTDFIQTFENTEPKNAVLFLETAQLFARLCGRNGGILQCTYLLVEKAVTLDTANANYVTELGYQCLLQGKIRDAMKFYKNATKLDESSIDALLGMIFCQILEGQLDAAEQQLELLKEIHRSTGMTSTMLFLCGMSSQRQMKGPEEIMGYLNECVEKHFALIEGLPYGIKYFILLNPDFLLLVVKLYMNFIPDQPIAAGQPLPPALKKTQSILQPVTTACPGLLEASFLMAKLKYLSGDMQAAQNMLHQCLESDSAFSDARLLLAQIMLHEGNHQTASQALEIALSYSFDVREKPQFHLIKAKIQKQQGSLHDAVKTLQTGMSLAALKPSSANKKSRQELSTNDKVSLYLELADAYQQLNQQHEAVKTMQDATNAFQGTAEEVRITVMNADLALKRGNIDEALSVLRTIGPEQPYYHQAMEKMANIYLHHRKDRRLFASCYREVVEKFPTPQSFLLLGDAYMSIQEPERAIEVYEQALKKNPRDSMLARKIGQAFVKTHHYEKAVTYYKAAIKTGGQVILRYDLAELLFRMKRYKEAEDVISSALDTEKLANDITWLQWEAKFLLLLSQVCTKIQSEDKAVTTLQRAWDAQTRVMRRIHVEQPDSLPEQRQIAINICRQLAEHASARKDYSPAIQFYKEALTFDDNNSDILLALAKLEMAANNLDSARQYCTAVLKGDTENDSATLMMADLMFRKTDLESAMFHFQQLLDRKPDYFRALARFIEAVRRLGKLEEVPHYLQKAEQCSSRTAMEAGFNYCKGLYEWYTGNTSGAMKCFNKARHDAEWGQIATYHMIEICVNPDNETLGGESFDGDSDDILHERTDSQETAVRTAEKLLNELKTKVGPDLDVRIMNNFVLIAKRNKADAEEALNDFLQIMSDERHRDHVGAILGMSTAHIILKQTPRARNQLKRVSKNIWNFGDAEYLERAWLLLSDIYIKSGKLELASDLLKRVLQHNKSCTKAYDYMGYIMEKEQNYRDAAHYYELAWKQTNRSNPVIGYKLGFNYMKAKRYVDAIDICHAVLKKFPNYPKIRKEILEKSRSNLRI